MSELTDRDSSQAPLIESDPIDLAVAFEESLREGFAKGLASDWSRSIPPSRVVSVLKLLNAAFQTGSTRTLNVDEASDEAFVVPETVGRFRIDEPIGRGGFGVVYRAYDDTLRRKVAVKAIHRQASHSKAGDEDRLREARAAARLSHPCLVPLYEVFDDEKNLYLISEFCDGPTLAAYLRDRDEPLSSDWAVDIALKLAQAVAHAHGRGLVHRDIKPSNVLLDPERTDGDLLPFTPRLTDFGLVIEADNEQAGSEQQDIQQSRLAGTILYMAPEHLMGDGSVDAKSGDIYAIGLLLYEMLNGGLPYRSTTPLAMFEEICTAPVPLILQAGRPIPKDLHAIYQKALAKDHGTRYQSMQTLVDDLIRFREGEPVSARPLSRVQEMVRKIGQQPLLSGLLFLLFMLAIGSASVFALNNQTLRRQRTELNQALSSASESHRNAIEIAFRSDLYQGFLAVSKRDPATALSLIRQVEGYATDEQLKRFDLRVLSALAKLGWQELEPLSSNVEEIVSIPESDHFLVGGGSELRLYDGQQIEPIRVIEFSDDQRLHALAVAQDADLIAIGTSGPPPLLSWLGYNNETVQFISLSGRDVPKPLTGFDTTIESLAFNHDGSRLAVGTRYEPIVIVDLVGDADRLPIEANRRNEDLKFHPNEELAWLSGGSQWSRRTLAPKSDADVQSIDISPLTCRRFDRSADGRWLAATVFIDGDALLYDLRREVPCATKLKNEHGELHSIGIAPNGRTIAAGTLGGGVAVWHLDCEHFDCESIGESTESLEVTDFRSIHGGLVGAVCVNDSGTILSGAEDGSLAMWKSRGDVPLVENGSIQDIDIDRESTSSCMTPDAQTAMVGCEDGAVWRVNLETWAQTRLREPTDVRATAVAISNDGRFVAVGYDDGRAFLGSVSQPDRWRPLPPQTGEPQEESAVEELHFNRDASRMVVRRGASRMQWLQLQHSNDPDFVTTISVTAALRAPTQVTASLLVDDDTAILLGEKFRIWDAESSTFPRSTDSIKGTICGCYDDQRKLFYVGCLDGRIRQLSSDGKLISSSRRWMPPVKSPEAARQVFSIALSPDGDNLLTGSHLGDVAIWETDSLKFLGTIAAGDSEGSIECLMTGQSQRGDVLLIHQCSEFKLSPDVGSRFRIIRVNRVF